MKMSIFRCACKVFLANIVVNWFIIAPYCAAQTQAQKIEMLLQHCYDHSQFNGSALVAQNGKIVYNAAFGFAEAKTKTKALPITAFNLASVSKQFTAMAVMILQERGRLRYDDDMRKYLPELPYQDITVRHLLTHTSGLPDYIELFDQRWDSTQSPAE